MNLLLDTHVSLWALEDHPTLSPEARAAIIDGGNLAFVSVDCPGKGRAVDAGHA